jgi:excisionase family DNA binding protein
MSVPFSERPTCSVNEACAAIPVGRSYLYELIAAGKVRKIKLGKKTLIDVPSLLAAVRGDAQRPSARDMFDWLDKQEVQQ